jgi:hypothetical protein
VFPARYELNSYIVFRKRLVSKRLNLAAVRDTNIFSDILTLFLLYSYLFETIHSLDKKKRRIFTDHFSSYSSLPPLRRPFLLAPPPPKTPTLTKHGSLRTGVSLWRLKRLKEKGSDSVLFEA